MSEISKSTAQKFISRWKKLHDSRSKVDYETAGLAHEIRQLFPKGSSGDLQFMDWVQYFLGVWAPTAAMLKRAAQAFILFPDEADWVNFGGWQSMSFMLSFNTKDRRRIVKASRQIIDDRDKTIGYSTVRNAAYALGCRQNRVLGRPNRTEVEEKLGALRTYVQNLLDEGVLALDDLPDAAKEALTPTKLAQLEASLGGG